MSQLQELDNLVKTVKYKQRQLADRSEDLNQNDIATQITPSISRLESDRRDLPENDSSFKVPQVSGFVPDRLKVAELENQKIDISIRNVEPQILSHINPIEKEESCFGTEESFLDSDVEIIEPEVLNSAVDIKSNSSNSNPLRKIFRNDLLIMVLKNIIKHKFRFYFHIFRSFKKTSKFYENR